MASDLSGEPPVAPNPYEVLGLLPSAPQELVVEVYWESVHRLRASIANDAERRQALASLNGAYATICGETDETGSEGSVTPSNGAADATAPGGKPTLLQRLLGRDSEDDVRLKDDCWQVLSVAPSAAPEVLELAFGFCLRRIRGQFGAAGENAEQQLRDAYDAAQVYMTEASFASESASTLSEELQAAEGSRDADERSDTEAAPAETLEPSPKKPSRLATAISASASATSHWGAAAGNATREWLKAWAANPLHENGRQQPLSSLSDPGLLKERQPRANATPEPGPQPRPVNEPEMEPDAGVATPVIARERLSQQEESVGPRLVTPRGDIVAITSHAITIGSDPICDIVARGLDPESEHVSAHVWAEESRIVLHVVGEDPAVRINGVAALWAFLEDGDELRVGQESYRFRTSGAGSARESVESGEGA